MVDFNLNSILNLIRLEKRIRVSNLKENLKKDGIKVLTSLKRNIKRISEDLTKDQVRHIKQDIRDTFFKEVQKNIQSPQFVDAVVTVVSRIVHEMQREYWGGSGDLVLKEDPTQLIHPEHLEAIKNEVIKNTALIVVNPKTGLGSFEAISHEFSSGSKDEESSANKIPWLEFFMNGHMQPSNLIWVNQEVYEIFKREPSGSLGRFGVGYMWQLWPGEDKFRQEWLTEVGSKIKISDLVHGQSGKPGRDWFGNILGKIDFAGIVTIPAKEATDRIVKAKWDKILKSSYNIKL